MKAYVTSIGEPTTELCVWALERNGFEVYLLNRDDSLARKLATIYKLAEEDFLRVDADIIVNRNMTPDNLRKIERIDYLQNAWWIQFVTFDWFKQDITHSMSYIKKEALPSLRANIGSFKDDIRPETQVSRIEELHNPRRMETYDNQIMGVHGYGIKDIKPVIKLKANRGQSHLYDFELARKLNEL